MPYETTITAPDGSDHVFESDFEPTVEQHNKLLADFSNQWNSNSQSRADTLGNALSRGAAQSAASLVEGTGDLLSAEPVSRLGRDLKESASSVFEVDPARERDFSTKAAGVVGQAAEQAAELIAPISKFGALSKATKVIGLGSAGIKGADAGEDVARQFGVDDDPAKRYALMLGFGAAEAGSEMLGGLGTESTLANLLTGRFKAGGLGEFAKHAGIEGLEEGVNEVADNTLTRAIVTPEEAKLANQDLPGYLDHVLENTALGSVAGVTMSVGHLGGAHHVPGPVEVQAADTVSTATGELAETPEGLTTGVLATDAALSGARTEPIVAASPAEVLPEDLSGNEVLGPPEEIAPVPTEPLPGSEPLLEEPSSEDATDETAPAEEAIPAEEELTAPEDEAPVERAPNVTEEVPAIEEQPQEVLPEETLEELPSPETEVIPEVPEEVHPEPVTPPATNVSRNFSQEEMDSFDEAPYIPRRVAPAPDSRDPWMAQAYTPWRVAPVESEQIPEAPVAESPQEEEPAVPEAVSEETPPAPSFGEALVESLPEKARPAWTAADIQAANTYAETGDSSVLKDTAPIKRKRIMEAYQNQQNPEGQQFSLNPPAEVEGFPTEGERKVTGRHLAQSTNAGDQITLGNGDVVRVKSITPHGGVILTSDKYGDTAVSRNQNVNVAKEFLNPESRGFPADVLVQGDPISQPVASRMMEDLKKAMKAIGIPGNVEVQFFSSDEALPDGVAEGLNRERLKGLRVDSGENSVIYLNRGLITSDTPVHEMMHGFVPQIREQMPELYQQGIELLEKNKAFMRAVRGLYGEGMTQDQLYEEALTSVLGIEGRKLWNSTARSAEWVNQMRRFVAKVKLWLDGKLASLGLRSDMTLEQWARSRNREVLTGSIRIPSTENSRPAAAAPVEKASKQPEMKPSGLGENALKDSRTPEALRATFRDQTYQGEKGEDAVAQANQIFDEVQKIGSGWEGHINRLARMLSGSETGQILNMTPGAYFGRTLQELRKVEENPKSSLLQKNAAQAAIKELAQITALHAARAGQFVKGLDIGWKLASPEMVLEATERDFIHGDAISAREHTDAVQDVVDATFEAQQEGLKQLSENPGEMEAAVERTVGKQIRGDETGDAAESEIDAESDVAEHEKAADSSENLDWFTKSMNALQGDLRTHTMAWLRAVRKGYELDQRLGKFGGKASLDSSFLDGIDEEIAAYDSMTPEQLTAERSKVRAEEEKAMAALRATGKKVNPEGRKRPIKNLTPAEQAEHAGAEMARVLTRMVEGKKKKGPLTPEQEVVKSIIEGVAGKAGLNIKMSGDISQDRAVAFGLLLTNQDLAYSALERAKALLEANPATKDLLTDGQLKALGQMVIGKQFSDDPDSGAPFGLRQVAQVRRAEMETAKADIRKVAMDASLANRTAKTIENQLRDPARGLEKRLGKEGLDKVVSAVMADYRRTLAERETAAREREKSVAVKREGRRLVAKKNRADRAAERAVKEADRIYAAREKKILRDETREFAKRRNISETRALRAIREAQERGDKLDREETRQAIVEARRANRDQIRQRQKQAEPVDVARRTPGKVIDYLIRRHGLDLKDLTGVFDEAARAKGVNSAVEKMMKNMAEKNLGLTPDQTRQFMKPVVAEGMKYLDTKRKVELKRRLETGLKNKAKRKPRPTELTRMMHLAELGGLDAAEFSDVLLGAQNKQRFTPEFKAKLTEYLRTANDPSTPPSEALFARQKFAREVEAAKGVSLAGIGLGTWMAHIFAGFGTQKVNALAGAGKVWMDNVSYANAAARAAKLKGPAARAAQKALLVEAAKGYSKWVQAEARYMWKTGYSSSEDEASMVYANSVLETMKDGENVPIKYTQNGKPVPEILRKIITGALRFHPYVRRGMTAMDLLNRGTGWQMIQASQAMRALVESGKSFTKTSDWIKAIEELNYGPGGMKTALAEATRQAAEEVRAGKVAEGRRNIRVQELMDGRMAEALGMSGPERLTTLREEAKRWTLASQTPGVMGRAKEIMDSAAKSIPAFNLLVPTRGVPMNAAWQTLDWTPYGFLRAKVAEMSGRQMESASTWFLDRDGKKRFLRPAALVTDERVIDLRNKATIGTLLFTALGAILQAHFDDDDDKAPAFVTGQGPLDFEKRRQFKTRGLQPFTMRLKGYDFNYRESPLFAPLAVLGAWSDAMRYGKMDETTSEKLQLATQAAIGSFTQQAVLRSLNDALGVYAGGDTRRGSPAQQVKQLTSRIGASFISPNAGREVNQILYGPANAKEQSWAGNLLENVPFVESLFRKPAINALGDEIHQQRGISGEIANTIGYRVATKPVDDDQLHLVARLGINQLSTTRRTKTGEEVMEDYDLVRKWAQASGKKIREYLTPEKMKELDGLRKTNRAKAEEKFDDIVKDIRTRELDKLLK